jgi:hypothetical protein
VVSGGGVEVLVVVVAVVEKIRFSVVHKNNEQGSSTLKK